jgi:hypothetical protein
MVVLCGLWMSERFKGVDRITDFGESRKSSSENTLTNQEGEYNWQNYRFTKRFEYA